MLLAINQIKVAERIRKEFGNIEELANDIKENGLINPPVVTPEYELIAGERSLRACRYLNYQQIEVRVMSVRDYEHKLKIEIGENEHRKEFTFSERMAWARELERVESAKARERETAGKKIDPMENFPRIWEQLVTS
ncbi:ParB N-terminal domain-containing protein [Bacillus cereus]|uniref:ParB-like partition protein n=1 Tax=Bacillus cereus VD184 TaxID=1053242 RepID=A0A9W5RAZ0_BACCE|nr:ParB N-terminal domain-containing protein [Bacillus cereus]EOQ18631.1 ParB-like partition protein [Bacillus cereus VD184]